MPTRALVSALSLLSTSINCNCSHHKINVKHYHDGNIIVCLITIVVHKQRTLWVLLFYRKGDYETIKLRLLSDMSTYTNATESRDEQVTQGPEATVANGEVAERSTIRHEDRAGDRSNSTHEQANNRPRKGCIRHQIPITTGFHAQRDVPCTTRLAA